MITGRSAGLVLLIALVTGCSSSSALDDVCVPELTCKTHLELIEEPAGCSSCDTCANDWGSCNPGGLACKRGQLDLSTNNPSCEAAIADVSAQYVAHSTGDPSGTLSINKDDMSETIAVAAVALDAMTPGCVPTSSASCAYIVQALQVSVADFMIEPKDTLTWSNGTLTLTGPVAASDNGSGVAVPAATAVLAFDVSSSSGHRLAVASGTVSLGVVLDYTAHAPVSVQLEAKGFDFGGYGIDGIFLNGPLSAQ